MVMERVGAAKGDGKKSNGKTFQPMHNNVSHVSFAVKNTLRALVVDSDRTCNSVEKAILRAHGLVPFGVGNGVDALDLIDAGASFHLMVIDQYMPYMQGAELIRRIRHMGIQCKIIGISADGEEDRAEMMGAGADAFAEKPLGDDVLHPILLELHASQFF